MRASSCRATTSRTSATSWARMRSSSSIRPAGSNGHDQVRILTPEEAIERGADYLVVGRAISESRDPAAVARALLASVR